MAKRYLIETFGCQMNVHDSERMAGLLEHAGYVPATEDAGPDVVVVHTCSVRERAEDKLYARLAELSAAQDDGRSKPVVAVTGCVAQQEGESLAKRHPGVDIVVGTQALKRLPDLLADVEQGVGSSQAVDINPYEDVSFPLGVVRRSDPVKAYVTVIEGCNDYCSYCVVPYTRGHERMRPLADIVAEVSHAVQGGRREVHLLGQIVNHYVAPDRPGTDFAGLLEAVHEVPGVERIRFASPHPRHVTPRMIEAMRVLPRVCRHLHLPLQSGSNRVLARMRRRHTREQYLDLVDALRAAMPSIALSTDMIVGFPGESAEDFEDSLSLVRRVHYTSMFSFKYSPRPHTLAAKRLPDDVPEPEKTRRIMVLQDTQKDIQLTLHQAVIGSTVSVLADSVSRRRADELAGRTGSNVVVNFPGPPDWIGRFIDVRVERAGPNSLSGRPVSVEGVPLRTGDTRLHSGAAGR